jgi:hypothetical protein
VGLTPTLVHSHIWNKSMCWSCSHNMCAQEAFLQENKKFAPKQSKYRYVPSPRSLKWTDNLTRWLRRKENIIKTSANLLRDTAENDPASKYKLAVPLTVPTYMYTHGKTENAKPKAIGDMTLIAFYYLIRVGEYTCEGNKSTWTQQFQVQDITLWSKNTILDKTLPSLSTLLTQCTAATMNIDNKKNGKRNQSVHHEAKQGNTCPVKALIRRLHHISSNTSAGHTIISTYSTQTAGKVLRATDINSEIKAAVIQLDLR